MPGPRSAPTIFAAALALGLLGDHLFRAPVWGLNAALWAAALAGRGLILGWGGHPEAPSRPSVDRLAWPWLAASFFVGMWAVRDAPMLLAVDLIAALGLLSLPLVHSRGMALDAAGAAEVLAAPLRAGWHATAGGVRLAHALRPLILGRRTMLQRAGALGVGLLLALPPVVVFGSLFASADPFFSSAVSSVVRVDLEPLVSHLSVAGALTWATGGYLWALARPTPARYPLLPRLATGIVPVLTALGATALVFTIFVSLQAGSLFGGEAFVREQTGLTYAEYARRGFFQMMAASALSLPLVYAAPFLGGYLDERSRRSLHALLAVQLGLTALVLASALWRMGLYVRAYGLTEDRLYGTVAMLWIGATIAVFTRTVLSGRPRGAAFGSLVAAVGALALLNLANPQAFIARYNLAHQDRREADLEHLLRLGGDAVPVLVSRLDMVAPESRCQLVSELVGRHAPVRGDWRGWNLARSRARRAVRTLERQAGSCTAPTTPAQEQVHGAEGR